MFEKGFSRRNLPYFRRHETERSLLGGGLCATERLAAIAQGLGDVDAADAFFPVEIG